MVAMKKHLDVEKLFKKHLVAADLKITPCFFKKDLLRNYVILNPKAITNLLIMVLMERSQQNALS